MYYTSFRIQNFKGIKDTTIKLAEQSKIGVFAFVGLNESGKTTILEAIHSFSPDLATSEVVGGKGNSGVPFLFSSLGDFGRVLGPQRPPRPAPMRSPGRWR